MDNEAELLTIKHHFKSLTLLCVKNSSLSSSLYKDLLQPLFKKVIMVDSAKEALSLYDNGSINIIFTDYQMPFMNGLEMIQMIRQNNKEIPIVFISEESDSSSVIIDALELGVNHFLKKPIEIETLLEVLTRATKVIIANKTLQNSYQEELGFFKELNILRNDFYYHRVGKKSNTLIDFIYMPLDTLSGDAYSARFLCENHYFYLIVDGMGKGISASYTSILITSFINYKIDQNIKDKDTFSLNMLIKESINYIQPILLEEESLSVTFIEMNMESHKLNFALFSMPPLLLQDKQGTLHKIRSNNQPISKYENNFVINSYEISDMTKYLFYSDGLNENSILGGEGLYARRIQEDFLASLTREDLKQRILNALDQQEMILPVSLLIK
jgi:two-component system, HptB-dependent secretion and biofilm response regulator